MSDDERIDPERYRNVLSHYPTGVSVVTAMGPAGRPAGMVVGTFTSVSLAPPLVAFLPDKSSTSWPQIRRAGSFCVNVLGADQENLCRKFAQKGGDKFAGTTWRPGSSGSPILDGVVAWVDCDIEQVFESGDHYIVVGRVRDLDIAQRASPLTFYQGAYGVVSPPATQSSPTGAGFGSVVAQAAELFAEQGFSSTTMEDIAERAGIPPDRVYEELASEEAIMNGLLTNYVTDLLRRYRDALSTTEAPADALKALIASSFDAIDDHRAAIIVFQNERSHLTDPPFSHIPPMEREMQSMWTSVLKSGIDSGHFSANLDPRIVYRFIRDATFMAVRWYRPDGELSSAEIAAQYADLALHGVLARDTNGAHTHAVG